MVKKFLAFSIILPSLSQAIPIDWHGAFGVDITQIGNYNRLDQSSNAENINYGSQEVLSPEGGDSNASWGSYLLKLAPIIIINDVATFKGEISSGYARGGILGDGMSQSLDLGMGNALYPHNFPDKGNALILNKFLVELYADTATYRIGRHDSHFGLGTVINAGNDDWDRFSTVRDGITLDVQLGNFFIAPYWAQISSSDSLSGNTNVKDYGIQLNYKNVPRDVSFGILYSSKTSADFHSTMKTGIKNRCLDTENKEVPCNDENTEEDLLPIRGADITITDFYFQKKFHDFQFALEIPLIDGTLGNLFGKEQGEVGYKARAIIFESSYQISPKWSLQLNAGEVSGDSGKERQFEAMYLHPNYKIANLLFRYNRAAVATKGRNAYDSYLTNARYLKLAGEYAAQKWTWKWAFIKAWALTTAQAEKVSFNHQTNKRFEAKQDQNSDLGLEFDINFKYQWNSDISINGSFGYLLTGDYWKFTNDPGFGPNTKNSYALQLQTAVSF